MINFSISGGAHPYTDPVELAFLDAYHAGISVNASAGNSGPGAATSDHGGPWVTTVGASTGPRAFRSTLHLTADGGATFDQVGHHADERHLQPDPGRAGGEPCPARTRCARRRSPPGAATGKIVACQRGGERPHRQGLQRPRRRRGRDDPLQRRSSRTVETDNHWLPAIHIDGPSGPFTTFITAHTNVRATWAQGNRQPGAGAT